MKIIKHGHGRESDWIQRSVKPSFGNNEDHVNIWEGSFQTEWTARAKATRGNLFPRWLQWCLPATRKYNLIPFSPWVWAGFGNSLELPQNETGVPFWNYWGQVIQSCRFYPGPSDTSHRMLPLWSQTPCPEKPRDHMEMFYSTSLVELLTHNQHQLPLIWGATLDVQSSPSQHPGATQAKFRPAEPSQPQHWERQS